MNMMMNSFESIPECIRTITSLQVHQSDDHPSTSNPAVFILHALVQRLQFADNVIRIIPQWIGNLTNLNVNL
jgi:hypothetical protein